MSESKLGYITLFDKQGKARYRACNAVDRVDYLKSMATRKMKRLGLYSATIEWDGYVYFKPGGRSVMSAPKWGKVPASKFTGDFPGKCEEKSQQTGPQV